MKWKITNMRCYKCKTSCNIELLASVSTKNTEYKELYIRCPQCHTLYCSDVESEVVSYYQERGRVVDRLYLVNTCGGLYFNENLRRRALRERTE